MTYIFWIVLFFADGHSEVNAFERLTEAQCFGAKARVAEWTINGHAGGAKAWCEAGS